MVVVSVVVVVGLEVIEVVRDEVTVVVAELVTELVLVLVALVLGVELPVVLGELVPELVAVVSDRHRMKDGRQVSVPSMNGVQMLIPVSEFMHGPTVLSSQSRHDSIRPVVRHRKNPSGQILLGRSSKSKHSPFGC